MSRAISAVGVVITARDEQDRIAGCLRAVRRAAAELPTAVRVAVSVVLDRCTDHTPTVVTSELAGWLVRPPPGAGVGWLRHQGIVALLRGLAGTDPRRVWLASTDADTVVPENWLVLQLRHADAGAHAVAGLSELAGTERLVARVQARYAQLVASRVWRHAHGHVYAANLGVRADAYLACGGFPAEGAGEEHHLWRTLGVAGFRRDHPHEPLVRTSARRTAGPPAGWPSCCARCTHCDTMA